MESRPAVEDQPPLLSRSRTKPQRRAPGPVSEPCHQTPDEEYTARKSCGGNDASGCRCLFPCNTVSELAPYAKKKPVSFLGDSGLLQKAQWKSRLTCYQRETLTALPESPMPHTLNTPQYCTVRSWTPQTPLTGSGDLTAALRAPGACRNVPLTATPSCKTLVLARAQAEPFIRPWVPCTVSRASATFFRPLDFRRPGRLRSSHCHALFLQRRRTASRP